MPDDTEIFKRTVHDHGQKIAVMENTVERLERDMQEQANLMREVRDAVGKVYGAVLGGTGLIALVGTVIGIIVAFK